MIRSRMHHKHMPLHKSHEYLEEEKINEMIQIEASELYDRVGWIFGNNLNELLAQEVLESKELH